MKFTALAVPVMAVLQILLFLLSWLITAASPESEIRSLLGSEGIRWFFASFPDNVASPPLVWIITAAAAYGCCIECRMIDALRSGKTRPYRQTFALRIVMVECLIFIVAVLVVAFIPHAALLSVTGQLFPSSFSHSLIPMLAFCVIVASVSYGSLAGNMRSIRDVIMALSKGIASAAPLILMYLLAAELFFSVIYVFRL
jgi:aminobenzoyl-glutamate transport protein